MSKRKMRARPPYSSLRPQGSGFRLQILDPETGQKVRPRDLLGTEPAYYETQAELWEAYNRLTAVMDLRLQRGETLRGFWTDWTDPDHWRWGTDGSGRKPQSLTTQARHTRRFVMSFPASKTLASVTVADIEGYMKTKPSKSSIPMLDQMFRAAVDAEKRLDNPFERVAKNERKAAYRRRDQRERLGDNEAPSPEQIAALLDKLLRGPYPYGLYAWFLIGTEVGMRSGEIDGMQWDDLDLSDPTRPKYTIARQVHADPRVGLTLPKYNSVRTILLPSLLVPVLHRLKAESNGSPFVLTTTRGEHWRNSARAYYWNDDESNVRGGREGLRHVVGNVSMYCATRAYFGTQAVLSNPERIPQIAKHYGHKDNGKVLLQFYARLTDEHGQDGMADVYASRNVQRQDRRRAA